MTGRFTAVATSVFVERRLEQIGVHLDRLAGGHDPLGHLLAIERLARATRADWRATVQPPTTGQPR